MKQSTPTPDQGALERAADFLWPRYYASDENNTMTREELIANDGSCAALAWLLDSIEAKARAAERKTIIQELSACPENLRVRLKQHPSYSCECALIIATWLATTRRRRDDRVS